MRYRGDELNPIITCPVCGAPYQFYAMMVGDQTICPDCRAARNQALDKPSPEQEAERRRRRKAAFG